METAMSRFVDVSHAIEDGLITYPGLPAPRISDHLSRDASAAHYAAGTTFQIGRIEMVANTGTYLDVPFHRYAGGFDLSRLSLSSAADLPGIAFRANPDARAVDRRLFEGRDLRGNAILVHTGWDRHWGTPGYFESHPFLTRDAVEYLAASGAALVGIDSLNIDDTADGSRPAHSILLGNEIPIVEHLCNLQQLPDSGFRFFAVPVKVKGMGSFPVRAFAIVDN
jgi:kynurenine formamidase